MHAIDIAHTIASMLTMYQTKRKTCKIFDFRFDFFLLGFWLSSKVELVDFFCKRTKRFSIWKINMRNELGKKRRKKCVNAFTNYIYNLMYAIISSDANIYYIFAHFSSVFVHLVFSYILLATLNFWSWKPMYLSKIFAFESSTRLRQP